MIRYFRYLVLVLLAVVLVTVALANRAPVSLQALPDDLAAVVGLQWAFQLPLFVVIFGGIAAGVLLGFVWEWLREHKHRATARTKAKEVSKLERELSVMRDSNTVPQDDVIALIDGPKAR